MRWRWKLAGLELRKRAKRVQLSASSSYIALFGLLQKKRYCKNTEYSKFSTIYAKRRRSYSPSLSLSLSCLSPSLYDLGAPKWVLARLIFQPAVINSPTYWRKNRVQLICTFSYRFVFRKLYWDMDWNFEMKVLEARSKMKLKHCKNKKKLLFWWWW